jgi:hypothetical protein
MFEVQGPGGSARVSPVPRVVNNFQHTRQAGKGSVAGAADVEAFSASPGF